MSEVKRYSCWCCHRQVEPVEMVEAADYEALAAENKRLREALEGAPHETMCAAINSFGDCDCWKSEVLEASDE
jgi:hypothetical protein